MERLITTPDKGCSGGRQGEQRQGRHSKHHQGLQQQTSTVEADNSTGSQYQQVEEHGTTRKVWQQQQTAARIRQHGQQQEPECEAGCSETWDESCGNSDWGCNDAGTWKWRLQATVTSEQNAPVTGLGVSGLFCAGSDLRGDEVLGGLEAGTSCKDEQKNCYDQETLTTITKH